MKMDMMNRERKLIRPGWSFEFRGKHGQGIKRINNKAARKRMKQKVDRVLHAVRCNLAP